MQPAKRTEIETRTTRRPSREGVAAIEYCLVLSLIMVFLLIAAQNLGLGSKGLFQRAANVFASDGSDTGGDQQGSDDRGGKGDTKGGDGGGGKGDAKGGGKGGAKGGGKGDAKGGGKGDAKHGGKGGGKGDAKGGGKGDDGGRR